MLLSFLFRLSCCSRKLPSISSLCLINFLFCDPAAWGNLGNVLKSQAKMEEAEQAYRNALYYRSNMADMLYNL